MIGPEKIEQILAPVVAEHGLEIVDLDFLSERGGRVLRLFVDFPQGGVTLEDCARLSRDCSAVLDAEDIVGGSYRLEVSSPGVERRLRKKEHFERHLGQEVRVVLRESAEGRKRVTGALRAVRDDGIELEQADGGNVTVPLAAIKRANLKVF